MFLNDFTKGGQALFQHSRLFIDTLKKTFGWLVLLWLVSFVGLMFWHSSACLQRNTLTVATAAPFAAIAAAEDHFLRKIGLLSNEDPVTDFELNHTDNNGHSHLVGSQRLMRKFYTPSFKQRFKTLLRRSAIESVIGATTLFLLLMIVLSRLGHRMTEKKVLRGTHVTDAKQLKRFIEKKNPGKVSRLSLAGIPMPPNTETQHIWINGTTGSGKTVAFSDVLHQIREKGDRAIVYDIMGTFVSRFYRPGKDIILNPFDERSLCWDPWMDCESDVDFEMLAAAQIPLNPGVGNEDPFWKTAARSLYAATMRRLAVTKKANVHTLLRHLLTSDLDKLRALLKGTEAEALVSKDIEKTALSVKAILNDYVKGMRFLKPAAREDEKFSIREWVRRDDDDSWLFITSRADYHDTLIPLISTWINTAITESLSLPDKPNRRLYFPIDELPTLQYLPSLKKGMSLGRQKGLCFIIGTQGFSQMNVNFGVEEAKCIIGNANTKLILRSGDDAESIARFFNQSEVEENNESLSYGITDNRDGVSFSKQRHTQYMILPSELQMLDDLHGYMRLPGHYPIGKVSYTYVEYPEKNPKLVSANVSLDCFSATDSDSLDDCIERFDELDDAYDEMMMKTASQKPLTFKERLQKNKESSSQLDSARRTEFEANIPDDVKEFDDV